MIEPVMKFTINDKVYTIYNTDEIKGKSSYIGETRYDRGLVFIERNTIMNMLDTLRHELAHIWLYENGHPYQEGGCFTYEEVCEYISFSNGFIYKITEQYILKKGYKL